MILEKEKLNLSDSQLKYIKSGWGNSSVDDVEVSKIIYNSDGLKVKGFIAHPKLLTKKLPCIIWCRGGFGNAGALDDFNAQGILGQLAGWGYFVFSTQYRGNDGGEGFDMFGGDDLNDVLNLIPLANDFKYANSDIWGIEGWSRGGMMTYLTLTKTNIFKAAVVTGGITNLICNSNDSPFMKKLYDKVVENSKISNFKSFCSSRSILNFPDKLSKTTPLLLIHGNNDERVLPHDSIDMSRELLRQKIVFRLLMLENGDHFLKKYRQEVEAQRKKWFKKYLV